MSDRSRRSSRLLLVLAAGLVAMAGGFRDQVQAVSPVMTGHAAHAAQPAGHYQRSWHDYRVPEVALLSADGERVMLAGRLTADQPVLLNFIFTSCGTICPVQTATFAQLQRALHQQGEQVRLVSISIDPERDTPDRLRDYAGLYRAEPGWSFLTGSRPQIIQVQQAFEAYRGDKMSHTALTFIKAAHSDSWLRIEGFASASELLDEYHALVSR